MTYNKEKIRKFIDKEYGILPTSPTWLWNMTTVLDRNEHMHKFITDVGVGPDGDPAKYDEVHLAERQKLLGEQFDVWSYGRDEVPEEYIKQRGVEWVIANIEWLAQLGAINIDDMR